MPDPMPPSDPPQHRIQGTLFGRGSWPEVSRIAGLLRREAAGGTLLLAATCIALVWANSPIADSYFAVRDATFGPASLHLDLSLGQWASDGLLAIFFFVAGLELKREFVAGDLRDPRRAIVPVAAAVGGMIVPALVYLGVNQASGGGIARGWAIPTATDIAFALAVLAVISSHLPSALRTFLLTLAVVDDLLAIVVIAVFFTDQLRPQYLALALIPLALFGFLVQRRIRHWYLLIPLGVLAWALVHASGIHATVAGVLLAFSVPVLRSRANGGPAAGPGLAETFEHRLRPLSAGVAVPVFAFFAAGVAVGGLSGIGAALSDPITIGIAAGLVLGKPVGIALATLVVGKLAGLPLTDELCWWDVIGLAMLGGVGFTVSLLISELAFGAGTPADSNAKVGILLGSLAAALLSATVLRIRNTVYRRIAMSDELDSDYDGVPDVYETPPSTAAED
jgi:NhaA family Na+:H+ antiporter